MSDDSNLELANPMKRKMPYVPAIAIGTLVPSSLIEERIDAMPYSHTTYQFEVDQQGKNQAARSGKSVNTDSTEHLDTQHSALLAPTSCRLR